MRKTNGGQHAFKDTSIEFHCEEDESGALVSIAGLKFLPRIGETVMLPQPDDSSKQDLYEVIAINHNFCREMAGELPSEARLFGITISVKRA